jgi:phytanoyl-CoA hydroxylase
MHRSPANPSNKTRIIYTFHMIEGAKGVKFDERNWLAILMSVELS